MLEFFYYILFIFHKITKIIICLHFLLLQYGLKCIQKNLIFLSARVVYKHFFLNALVYNLYDHVCPLFCKGYPQNALYSLYDHICLLFVKATPGVDEDQLVSEYLYCSSTDSADFNIVTKKLRINQSMENWRCKQLIAVIWGPNNTKPP